MLDAHRDTLEASFGPSLEALRGRFERIEEIVERGGEVDGLHSSG
jgi:hypothetical protein